MNRFTCALITVLATAAPAFAADGDATTTTEAGTGAAVGGDATVNTGGAAGGMDANATANVAGTMTLGWSPQLITSAQTLPASAIGVSGTVEILRLNIPPIPPATTGSTITAEFMGLAGSYGITDKITAGGTYFFDLHDDGGTFPSGDRWKGTLGLNGAFNVIHKDKMSVSVGADFNINLNNTDSKGIGLGASAKYLVAPKIAVYTGNPVPIGPAGDHLTISLASKGPIDFRLPAGVALQATPELFAYLDMTLMNIGISNSSNAFIFSDFILVNAGGLFRATPDLDVGLMITDDLKNAGDAYIIGLTGRYYVHK